MRLVTFRSKEISGRRSPRVGALLSGGEHILDFQAAAGYAGDRGESERDAPAPADLLSWFDLDGPALKHARDLYDETIRASDSSSSGGGGGNAAGSATEPRRGSGVVRRADVELLAPVPRPGKLIAIGLNYRDHAAESNMPIPESPIIFSKFTTAVTGPDQPVVLPPTSVKVDYEAELAVVIGRRAKQVARERAYDYVLGYMNLNDVSARDFQFADGQWQRGKSCDTFAPIGPFIATTDELPDPHGLSIRFRLNGQTLQDSNTGQLIFDVAKLVAFLSETITLEPGDVIATGTPPGVGFARKPPIFLKPGDRMEVEIEGLGTLSNPVVAG